MNKKQYSVISLFFLGLMFFLQFILLTNPSYYDTNMYYSVRNGILSSGIYLSFPLFILFQVLAWLEPKKK